MKHMFNPSFEDLAHAFTDITKVKEVQVSHNPTTGILWINVDGVCVLRICRIENIIIDDGVSK